MTTRTAFWPAQGSSCTGLQRRPPISDHNVLCGQRILAAPGASYCWCQVHVSRPRSKRSKRKATCMDSSMQFETAAAPAPSPPVSDHLKLLRAKGYPYPRPDSSFVFVNGETYEFDDSQWLGAGGLEWLKIDTAQGRLSMAQILKNHGAKWELSKGHKLTPVLAVGSNAAPVQLGRKFDAKKFPDGVVIPVLRCVLPDFDVVYAPLISSYGSCTATLEYSPGSAVAIFVTYLQPELLDHMDKTEGAYNLCQLTEVQLQIGLGLQDYRRGKIGRQIISTVFQYNHQHGSLNLPMEGLPRGVPIAIKEIKALDRLFPALDQVEMQLACKHVLNAVSGSSNNGSVRSTAPPLQIPASQSATASASMDSTFPARQSSQDGAYLHEPQPDWLQQRDTLDSWILENLNDRHRRLRMNKTLVQMAAPFRYGASKIVKALGDLRSENVS